MAIPSESAPLQRCPRRRAAVVYPQSTLHAWIARELDADQKAVMKHFLLFYELGPTYLESRPRFRGAHLKHAWDAHDRGELIVAGAVSDPMDEAVLMFAGDNKEVAEDFARADPYVINGLVLAWHVREWTTVIGELAATPVRADEV